MPIHPTYAEKPNIKELKILSDAYRTKTKNYQNTDGVDAGVIKVSRKFLDTHNYSIYLVSDGFTDNKELEEKLSKNSLDNKVDFMNDVLQYMQQIVESKKGDNQKPDDAATPILVNQ